MAINPNNGVLDIINGTLKVSSIDIKQAAGFTTALNTVARNDVLLFDDQKATTVFTPTSEGGYMSSTGVTRDTTEGAGYIDLNDGWVYWPLQLPNSWHTEFDMHVTTTGGVLTFSLFNTSEPNHTDYTNNDGGYKIVFDNTTNKLILYYGGSPHKLGDVNIRSPDWQHVNINYFQGAISVSLAGKVVLTHEFTQNYQEFNSRYVGFSATAGASHKIRHLRVHNSDKWLYTKTSNASDITYVSGNVGIGSLSPTELLDVHGNVHIARDLTVDGNLTVSGTTTFIDTANMSIEDPIIELARGNASDTIDAGLVITRATSNVAVAYRGDEEELALGYTQSGASDTDVTPIADGGLDVRVYGNLFANNLTTTANVDASYINGNVVTSNLTVSGNYTMGGHIIPDTNDVYDIGSAEKKIRDIYVSDNSLWIGDETKISFSEGKMRFRKRKMDVVPAAILTAGGTSAGAKSFLGKTDLNDIKIHEWLKYMKTLSGKSNAKMSDVFRDNKDDYEVTTAAEAWKDMNDEIYTTSNVSVGKTTSPTVRLDVEGDGKFSGNVVTIGNIGISKTTPDANLHVVGHQYVNDPPTVANSFDHSDAPLTLTHGTPTSTTAVDDPKAVLHLTRDGTSGESYGARASFNLSRYENSGTASRSRLDVALADGTYAESNVMSIRADGRVGIGTTTPGYTLDVRGTANVGALTATSISGPLSGNATTATALETARTIGGVSFDGTANINLPGVNTIGNQDTTGNADTATALETARTIGGVSFDGTANIDLPGVNTAGTQNTSGNAATATALETARNINGVSFDGTGNITITANTPNTLTRGSYLTGSDFDGSAATTWAVDATEAATASKIVARDSNGDIFGSYVNISHVTGTRSTDTIFYSSTDDYIQKTNATGMRASLNVPTRTGGDASGTWGISITGTATSVSGGTAVIGTNPSHDDSFDYSDIPLQAHYNSTVTSNTTLNDPKSVMMLTREGTSSEAYGAGAAFQLSRWENNGTDSRSRLDIALTDSSFDLTSIMTMRSNGNVGIGTTSPGGLLHICSGTSGDAHLILQSDTDNNNETDNPKIVFRQDGAINTAEIGIVNTDNMLAIRGTGGIAFYDGSPSTGNIDYIESTSTELMRIATNGNVGIGTTTPSSPLHVSASTTSTHTMRITHNDTNATSGTHALLIDANYSGSDTFTGDKANAGLFIDLDSTATGGGTAEEHRIYGIFSDVRHSGDSDLVYGTYSYTRSDHTSGTTTNLRAGDFLAVSSGTGINTNIYGISSYTLKDGGSTGTTANMFGVRGEVEVDAGTCTNAYAFQSHIDRDGGTITTGYLYYGSYSGTVGTKWGVYVTGETKNYFSGNVGVGTTNPTAKLHVGGTGAIIIPSGTTAQQPTGQVGMVRFNTTLGKLQVHNGTTWSTIDKTGAIGGTVTNAGGYTIHTFTTSDDFVMYSGGEVEYLIVAGGGGGATQANSNNRGGGGGGAGGMLTGTMTNLTAGTYTITVGAGGQRASTPYYRVGTDGTDSIFHTQRAIGGGRGGTGNGTRPNTGGSGGGGGSGATPGTGASGTSGQGNRGGNGTSYSGGASGGSGGGAGGAGGNAVNGVNAVRIGGVGLASTISGSSVTYAMGGASCTNGSSINSAYRTRLTNTGDGGYAGGGQTTNSISRPSPGSDGIVIIRYLT